MPSTFFVQGSIPVSEIWQTISDPIFRTLYPRQSGESLLFRKLCALIKTWNFNDHYQQLGRKYNERGEKKTHVTNENADLG